MRKKSRDGINVAINADMKASLDIQLNNDINGMKNMLTLHTIVEECSEDGSILILMPIHQGYHYPLPRDEVILMRFFVESKPYSLLVQFEERIGRGGFLFAKMRRVSKIGEHQHRDCYRIQCSLPVTVERLRQNESERHPERQPAEGRMIDFSDGGMLFATDENIEKGEKIALTFDIGDTETIECMALRAEKIEEWIFSFKVAAQFKNTDKLQKHRFYKYIVDEQLEELRRWTLRNEPLYQKTDA